LIFCGLDDGNTSNQQAYIVFFFPNSLETSFYSPENIVTSFDKIGKMKLGVNLPTHKKLY
jgi:hypothetical protein